MQIHMYDELEAKRIAAANNSGEEDGWTYKAHQYGGSEGTKWVVLVFDEDDFEVGTL